MQRVSKRYAVTAATATPSPPPSQEPRTSRRTGERQEAHARAHPAKLFTQESDRKRPTGIGRWIEVSCRGRATIAGMVSRTRRTSNKGVVSDRQLAQPSSHIGEISHSMLTKQNVRYLRHSCQVANHFFGSYIHIVHI